MSGLRERMMRLRGSAVSREPGEISPEMSDAPEPTGETSPKRGDAARQPLGECSRSLEADQRDDPPTALQIVLGGENVRHLGRFLDERVPFGAIRALSLPAMRHRPAGLADIARLGLGHARNNTRTKLP